MAVSVSSSRLDEIYGLVWDLHHQQRWAELDAYLKAADSSTIFNERLGWLTACLGCRSRLPSYRVFYARTYKMCTTEELRQGMMAGLRPLPLRQEKKRVFDFILRLFRL